MKNNLFLVVLILIIAMLITGCGEKKTEVIDNTENLVNDSNPVINDNLAEVDNTIDENTVSTDSLVKYSTVEDYYNIINSRGSDYDERVMPKDVFLNVRLIKSGDMVVLKSDIGNPYSFTLDEVKKVVEDLEQSDETQAKLGVYTISKEYNPSFKYEWWLGDFEMNADEKYSFDNSTWYSEEKIPYYVTDQGGLLITLKEIDGICYPYWVGVPIGENALVDDIQQDAFELVLDDETIILYEANGFYEDQYTAKNVFDTESSPIYGVSRFNHDGFEIENGIIRICTADADGL